MPRALRLLQRLFPTALLMPLAFAVGCDSSVAPPPSDRIIEIIEPGEATILHFMEVYSQRLPAEYAKLFTGDFRFEFSSAADPNLASEHPSGWTKADEIAAATNLFQGGVNNDGIYQPGALNIDVALLPTLPADDNGEGRDPTYYKVLLTSVSVRIDVPGDLTYVIGESPPQSNRFFLVRGDHAVGLEPDQPADAQHWYIWKWRDESPTLKARGPVENQSATWGRVKGIYR